MLEANRILKKKGRVILFEPNVSSFSYLIRKLFHHEKTNNKLSCSKDANDSNLAMANLIFEKNVMGLKSFKIVIKQKSEFLLYPLSLGIHTVKSLVPYNLYRFLRKIENLLLLLPIRNLVCFKMLIVLEKER